jgi:hypothetical protein
MLAVASVGNVGAISPIPRRRHPLAAAPLSELWEVRYAGSEGMTFAANFREHVTPRLINLAKAEAYCIAHNVETFHNAHRIVMAYARKYGALHLSRAAYDDLDELICCTLADGIEAEETKGRVG